MPYFFLSVTMFIWALNGVLGKAVTPYLQPMALGFWRWAIALLILLAFAWRQARTDWPVLRRHWRAMLLFGGTGAALHNAIAFWGLKYTTAVNGALLNSAVPVLIVAMSWLLFRERLSRGQAVGIAISTLGVLCILVRGDPANLLLLRLNPGDLLLLMSMVMWATYTACLRLKPAGLHPLSLVVGTAIVGLALIAPLYAVEHALGARVEWRWEVLAMLLFAGIFPSCVAYVLWNRGVAQVGANVASLFMHLGPVFGTGLAWLLLDERLHLFHVAGVLAIIAGIVVVTNTRRANVPDSIKAPALDG
jgi:drug/metabolite transporter (DMT)-like permease